MKTILITGASGFLADKIFDTLDSLKKYHIIMGARNTSKLTDVLKYYDIRKFNVSDEATYEDALLGVDVVIHLAAMDYSDCEKNPELANKVNVLDLEKFYKKCQLTGVKQFVYFSTIHVYGPNLEGKITEESPTNPSNIYSQTHLEAEKIVLNKSGIEGIVLRLSNAFGAPLHANSHAWKLVINDLCSQSIKNKKMVLNSSGGQLRDFIPASVLGHIVDEIILKNHSTSLYQIGSGICVSINEIAKNIQLICQEKFSFMPSLERKENPDEVIKKFSYSTDKLKNLGIEVKFDLKEELALILTTLKV